MTKKPRLAQEEIKRIAEERFQPLIERLRSERPEDANRATIGTLTGGPTVECCLYIPAANHLESTMLGRIVVDIFTGEMLESEVTDS